LVAAPAVARAQPLVLAKEERGQPAGDRRGALDLALGQPGRLLVLRRLVERAGRSLARVPARVVVDLAAVRVDGEHVAGRVHDPTRRVGGAWLLARWLVVDGHRVHAGAGQAGCQHGAAHVPTGRGVTLAFR